MMDPYRSRPTEFDKRCRSIRSRSRARFRSRHLLRLTLETLEPRHLLAGDPGSATESQDSAQSPPPITWFETFDDVPRIEFESLAAVDKPYADDFQGPRELAAGEWILQLEASASRRVQFLQTADGILDDGAVDFTVISGLGSEGLLLVRGVGVTQADIETSLRENESLASFTLNSLITGQSTVPNDSDYTAGLLEGLQAIGAETAWDKSRGDLKTVVGVVDSGIDLDHPDLYLNIWVNQGEIPASFKSDLVDIDGDGLITFYDLNNVTIGPAPQYVLADADFSAGPNAAWVEDLDHDGVISASDLLDDPSWADGRDTDGNGFYDDLFGVNFRSGGGEVLGPNEPDDALGHGTHVAGTIGAIGSNNLGVVGVNWQTSLMSLRILDNNNRSDAGSGLRAVNYARTMRQRLEVTADGRTTEGANVRVLNNSWGQPGGYEPAFEAAISEVGELGVLFVAAAGNGDIFGNGVNNDVTPFYSASYESDNIVSVAASTDAQELATFSNFGLSSVDLAAPGTGIRSTVIGGGYGSANGTSMAAPHVSGAAALLWSAFPLATVEEVKNAIVGSVDTIVGGSAQLTSGGALNVSAALDADMFGPAALLVTQPDITTSGGTSTDITVEYHHESGIDASSIGDDDLLVQRSWGPQDPIPAKFLPGSIVALPDSNGIAATYRIEAPGGGDFENLVTVPMGDVSPKNVTSQIMVSDVSQLIADFTLTLDIQHTDISALTATLVAPSGQRAVLFSGVGNAGSDLEQITLDDRAAFPITAVTPQANQSYRPVESLLALGSEGPDGVWTLEITDASPTGTGSLNGWSLDFTGSWDAVDYGSYAVSTVADSVAPLAGVQSINSLEIGNFQVRIEDDPSVLYVEQSSDTLGTGSLRDAIIAANQAAPEPRTIIVDSGHYPLAIAPEPDATSPFADPEIVEVCRYDDRAVWSDAASGDLDISGSIKIVGSSTGDTVIDGAGIDRVLKVHPGAELRLEHLTVSGGSSPPFQGGGGILSAGRLELHDVEVKNNTALEVGLNNYQHGGGVAVWGGEANIYQSWIHDNESNYGGAIYFCGDGTGVISHSTLSGNDGGGLHSHSDGDVDVGNSTFSGNRGGVGAIFNGKLNGDLYPDGNSFSPSISGDGRFVAFASFASNLIPGDNNDDSDVYMRDRVDGTIRRISVSPDGSASGGWDPRISADGRFVVFTSDQPLIAGNALTSLYVYDIENRQLERIRPGIGGTDGNGDTLNGALSADGRFVVFQSSASDLVAGDTNGEEDIFLYDRVNQTTERINVSDSGDQANDYSTEPTVSIDGRYVAFESDADNLVASDTNGNSTDIFVRDRIAGTTELVSLHFTGSQLRYSVGDPEISADGKFITFKGRLLAGLPDSVFLYDREAGTSKLISANQDPDADDARQPTISGDGRYVAYLVFSVSSGFIFEDVYLYDSETETLEQVNSLEDGLPPGADVFGPSLSADGGSVAVVVEGVFEPPDYSRHVYVYDLAGTVSPIVDEPQSLLTVSQTTIVNTEQAANSVEGRVHLSDTLVFSEAAGIGATVSLDNVVPQSNLIGPLLQESNKPPVHHLLFGSPAIDAGSERWVGDVDQIGTPRVVPDIGAQESVAGTVRTRVFIDRNADQLLGADEAGIPAIEVIARADDGEVFRSLSAADDPATTTVNETGSVEFVRLPADEYDFEVVAPPGWTLSQPTIQRVQAGDLFGRTALSGDGRYLAYSSRLPSLVPNDTNITSDVFVTDLFTGAVERVSVDSNGVEGNSNSYEPQMSADGRFVLFASNATNLVPNDTNASGDIFVHDRVDGTTERVNVGSDGSEANASVFQRLISDDGRYVFFDTTASNLVPNDTNNVYDVFVFDRQTGSTERLSLEADGSQRVSFDSTLKAISPDGRFVAYGFNSDAHILDRETGDLAVVAFGNAFGYSALSADGRFYVYEYSGSLRIWDRTTGTRSPFPLNLLGNTASVTNEANPSISDDGRFVVFPSNDRFLVPDDNNGTADIFVYDRQEDRVARVSVDADGNEANGTSSDPTITGDGLFIAFSSGASNLTSGDGNGAYDRFVTLNPFLPYVVSRSVLPGATIDDFGIGLIPDPGVISGRVYEDVIQNQTADPNEPGLGQWTVFFDDNGNQLLDAGERFAETGTDGSYRFTDVAGYQQHQLRVLPRAGWEQVSPRPSENYQWDLFVPVAADISGRDFGFRRIVSTGQSTNSNVTGRVFEDLNSNDRFDEGIDMPLSGIPVFLDANNDSQHNSGTDEPIEVTGADGTFQFSGQAARIVTVRSQLDEVSVLSNPVGNEFAAATYDLFEGPASFRTPSSAAHADFDQDGDEDIAVLLSDGNQLSIRLNEGGGVFNPIDIDISLAQTASLPGTSLPLEMVVGQFNNDAAGRFDIAIVGQTSNNVLVLLDYDQTSRNFLDRKSIGVGKNPISLTSGDFDNNGTTDLAVVNFGTSALVQASPPVFAKVDENYQLLLNDGAGNFSAQPALPVVGDDPVAIIADDFNVDGNLDLAVLHLSPTLPDTPFGDVALYLGNGGGAFSLSDRSLVEGGPLEMVTGDFNGDDIPDLAVANVLQNTLSVLTSNGDGTLSSEMEYPIGSGVFGVDSMGVADIDLDGDQDIVATRLQDGSITVFRNITDTSADPVHVQFEPLESFGTGQFSVFERAPIVLANFDSDAGGPNGSGTVDVVAISKSAATVNVLRNLLVEGGHRISLSGTNSINNVDFVVKPAVIPPTIDPIDDPPPIDEDESFLVDLTGISIGREDSAGFQITAFSSHPGIIPDPQVSYFPGAEEASLVIAPALDANSGISPNDTPVVITVEARNAGPGPTAVFGDGDDGVVTRSFTVTVSPVNDPPTFDTPSLISVSQKAGDQIYDAFVSNIGPGGGSDEAGQLLSDFIVVAQQSNLFVTVPAVDRQGRLTLTPDPNRAGITIVEVRLSDDGGTASGGDDTTTKLFAINVMPVNDPPSIDLAGNIAVPAGAGPQTVAGFASSFDPGIGDDDATQAISDFVVSVDRPDLFQVIPDIANDGTLTFTPLSSATGSAMVTVQVRDDGGRSNGGEDLSIPQQFTINFGTSPEVESVIINNGFSESRSQVTTLTVVFASEVDHAKLADAFTLTNIDTGIPVGTLAVQANDSGGKTSALLTFSGDSTVTRAGGNSLADGNYRLDITAGKITSPDGSQSMSADYQFGGQTAGQPNNDDFFRLYGDTDGDGDVDGQDYGRFGMTFLKQSLDPDYNADLDHDGDGDVDGQDYGHFGKRLLTHRN